MRPSRLLLALAFAAVCNAGAMAADAPLLGIVIMHGKGGAPTKHVAGLAGALESKGYRVANLEMPWSGRRGYDVDVDGAEGEVSAALAELRRQGARKVFIAGHSQGGLFALHLAGKLPADGIIAIAPGGSVANKVFRENLGASVAKARRLAGDGKGGEKTQLQDYEGSKGVYPVLTTPAVYLSWFAPEGAMNMERAGRAASRDIPILWIVAKNDYPNLRRLNVPFFSTLPAHPLTRLYEPDSDHLGAPSASLDAIVRWITEVAGASAR